MSPDSGIEILPGRSYPLGANLGHDGVNFSLFSANATQVELLLFDDYDQSQPTHTIMLDTERHKTYYYWHAFVRGVGDGQIYAYRVHGPYQPERGMRFNAAKVLLDPYGYAVAYGDNWSRARAYGSEDNTASALKSVVVDRRGYDWDGDEPLRRPLDETVIYEVHVGGLSADPSAKSACPGSYGGIIEKIPYLKRLGITAVELLPVQQFDSQEVQRINPLTSQPLENYWGYNTIGFFAPHLGYSCSRDARRTVDEFRDLVKALHRASIEVILDVVFNHTAEGDHGGPTISFRGLENIAYYHLKPDRRFYQNYAGTGNSVNCNHSVVRRLIRNCLRHWVETFHIDGFRFDLASVLSRDQNGQPDPNSPILWEIESDPVLAGTKLIAEAWDAAGLYQLGGFTGDRWAEWNGRFRDDVRRFVRGDDGLVRDFAWRMTGSFDIFRIKPSYSSQRSINFITCHDGFTLADLVSYNEKHNTANGEYNLDGTDANFSCNWGEEGPSGDTAIQLLRRRQMKNFMALLMVARGTPMLLGGDEMARTQKGNNNAYCQNNELSWFNWDLMRENADFVRFVKELIALRARHKTLTLDHALGFRPWQEALYDGVTFHGIRLDEPDWSETSHSLAIEFHGVPGDGEIYLIANAYHETLTFALPRHVRWRRVVDTSLKPPLDILEEQSAPVLKEDSYQVGARSVVILVERAE